MNPLSWNSLGVQPKKFTPSQAPYGTLNDTGYIPGIAKPGPGTNNPFNDAEPSFISLLWSELWGSCIFGLIMCLFVANYGGSIAARTMPVIYGSAFAGGFALFAATIAFGGVSGGHFNPAITISVMILEFVSWTGLFDALANRQRKLGKDEFKNKSDKHQINNTTFSEYAKRLAILTGYIVCQYIGYLIAAAIILSVLGGKALGGSTELGMPFVAAETPNVSHQRIFWAEIVGSVVFITGFLLSLKYFNVRNWGSVMQRATFLGFFYFVMILSFARFAGAVWNPALWVAFVTVGGRSRQFWILVLPSIIAGCIAPIFCVAHWFVSGFQPTEIPFLGSFKSLIGMKPFKEI